MPLHPSCEGQSEATAAHKVAVKAVIVIHVQTCDTKPFSALLKAVRQMSTAV